MRPENNNEIPLVDFSIDSVLGAAFLGTFISDYTVDEFFFPIQDNFCTRWHISPKIDYTEDSQGYAKIIYDQAGGTFFSSTIFNPNSEAIKDIGIVSSPPNDDFSFFDSLPHLSIAPVGKKYLVGVHNRVASDRGVGFDTGLKNFRLRFLKNIAKAKR